LVVIERDQNDVERYKRAFNTQVSNIASIYCIVLG
jgi:cytidylate kinase